MTQLPKDAEKLLAVRPSEFVAERDRVARELREKGRLEDAAVVASLRKPSVVVFAVNRAARDRPQAARAAADAAKQVEKAQGGGDPDAFRLAVRKLEEALDLLAEVAVAHVGQEGKPPTDAMRRRVHELLRRAVASDDTRAALSRGMLLEEPEAAGFAPFAGKTVAPGRRQRATSPAGKKPSRRDEERDKRRKALQEEIAQAEKVLEQAERAVAAAERERASAERTVAAIQAKLDRLTR